MMEIQARQHYPIDPKALPSSWAMAWTGDLCDAIEPGFACGEHNRSGQGVPHLRPMNIDRDGRLDLSDVKYVSAAQDTRRLNRGDVLFNNTNSPVLVGKTCHIDSDKEFAFSNHMTRLRIVDGVWPRFIAHQLHYLWMCGYFLHRCVKHVNQASISSQPLASTVPLAVAPSFEQYRIVDAIESHLTRLDAAVATLERVKVNLQRYRASVLKAAVEGRLVPTEAELARKEGRDYEPAAVLLERILKERRRRWEEAELAKLKAKGEVPKDDRWKQRYQEPVSTDISMLPELPEGWCWASVDMVGEVLLGRQRAPQYLRGLHPRPYLRVANVKDDALDLSDLETMDFDEEHFTKYRLRPEDILVSEGQSPELVGQSAIYHGGVEDLCFQKTLHRFRPIPPGPGSAYAQVVFRAHVRDGTFMRLASITTNIAHLTLEKFRASPFPLPPSAEQKRVVAETERLLSIADSVGRGASRQKLGLARLRQAVLKWAFEGKLVDQDPTDEPASALLERINAEREKAMDAGHERPRGARKRATI